MKLLLLIIPILLYSNIEFKEENYIQFSEGNFPLILTAPHGGKEKPDDIENRVFGKKGRDKNTDILTKLIANKIFEKSGVKPYVVVALIARKKVDLNRDIDEATQGDKKAQKIYFTYHSKIKSYQESIFKQFGHGLLLDIHGHSHPNPYIELGFLLSNNILKLPNNEIIKYKKFSSIRKLSTNSEYSFVDILKGKVSLSEMLQTQGYKVIPSDEIPYALDEKYFKGAYTTKTYGSLNDNLTDAIQVEFPRFGYRNSNESLQLLADKFSDSIIKFMKIHYK